MLPDRPFSFIAGIAAAGLTLASAGPAFGIAPGPYTIGDLRNYAQTLVAVAQVRQSLAEQSGRLPLGDRAGLQQKADAQVATILSRHDFSVSSFNAMSSQVEQQPSLTREVRQFVGQAQVEY